MSTWPASVLRRTRILQHQRVATGFCRLAAQSEGLPGLVQVLELYPTGPHTVLKGCLWAMDSVDASAAVIIELSVVLRVQGVLAWSTGMLQAAAATALGHLAKLLLRGHEPRLPSCTSPIMSHACAALDGLVSALHGHEAFFSEAARASAPAKGMTADDVCNDDENLGIDAVIESLLLALNGAALCSPWMALRLQQERTTLRVAEAWLRQLQRRGCGDLSPLRTAFQSLWCVAGSAALLLVVESRRLSPLVLQAAFRELVEARKAVTAPEVRAAATSVGELPNVLGLEQASPAMVDAPARDELEFRLTAVRVSRLALRALETLDPAQQAAHAAAVGALGAYLGDLQCERQPEDLELWELGLDALVRTLRCFCCPRLPFLLYEACWALNSALQSRRLIVGSIPVGFVRITEKLRACGLHELVAHILREQPIAEARTEVGPELAYEALLVLGSLDGLECVRQAMETLSHSTVVQVQACKVITELYRFGYRASTLQELKLARASVLRVHEASSSQELSALRGHAETALGALSQMEPRLQ